MSDSCIAESTDARPPEPDLTGACPDRTAAPTAVSRKQRTYWRTALLLLSSAAFGGVAVALWNRRTLLAMRQERDSPGEASGDYADEESPDEEISD